MNWSPWRRSAEPRVATGDEIAARLLGGEGAALQEDVGRLGEGRRFGQDLGEREVEIRLGVVELRRDGMRAQPGRNAALGRDRPQ